MATNLTRSQKAYYQRLGETLSDKAKQQCLDMAARIKRVLLDNDKHSLKYSRKN